MVRHPRPATAEDYQHEVVRASPSDCPAVEEALGDFDEPEIRGCRANQKDEEKRRWRDA